MTGAHQAPGPKAETGLRTGAIAVAVIAVAAVVALLLQSGSKGSHSAAGPPVSPVEQSVSASPPSSATAKPVAKISVAAVPTTPKPSVSPAAKTAPLTYVVRPGDNLTVIAAWFHLHGYGRLYEINKALLGDNPDLIHPGQRITISSRGVTTSG